MPRLFFAGLGVLGLGGIAALVLKHRPGHSARVYAALIVAGSLLVATPSLAVLMGSGAWSVTAGMRMPGGPWSFGLDALSAFFLVAIAAVGAATAVYGAGYFAAETRPLPVAFTHAGIAGLLIALALVVTARTAVTFLVSWELMAIAAFLLVMRHHELPQTRHAGLLYLASTHTGILALVAMFAVWGAAAPDLSFASLALAARTGGGSGTVAILVLALVGFGLKAGAVPFHFWLPPAHAAAPTPVSALMSGLVIKTGIYGLLRVAALTGATPAWYGWSLLALGLVSGVLGVVWALAQHDIKRLLAYHSVENIGIILIGMGVGSLGQTYGMPRVAALGYAGAILHVLNHALFKSLLFLGAGSIARGAGTRSLDATGGLARAMPWTWGVFLLASAAIVGLPPLNGFVSEWTIIQGLLGAGLAEGPIRVAIMGVAGMGLIGGLALACFAKVNGVVFLGHARTPLTAAARESGPALVGPMVALAAACVVIGLLPALVLPPALAAAGIVAGQPPADLLGLRYDLVLYSVIAVALAGAIALAWLGASRQHGRVTAHTWGCAWPDPSARMQYTASSFAAPVLEPFGELAGLRVSRSAGSYHTEPSDPGLDRVLMPVWRRLRIFAGRQRLMRIQTLHMSLLYVLATVVVLLVYLAMGTR